MLLYVVLLKEEDTTKDNKVDCENKHFNSIILSNVPSVFVFFISLHLSPVLFLIFSTLCSSNFSFLLYHQ